MESDSEADFDGRVDFSSQLEFNKLRRNLVSSGFREGAAAGKEASFQSGFDQGYAAGFSSAYLLGKFNGVVETLKINAESLSLGQKDLGDISFQNTRHGLCQLCEGSPKQEECGSSQVKDTNSIADKQRELTRRAMDEQKSKCLHLFQKVGVLSVISDE